MRRHVPSREWARSAALRTATLMRSRAWTSARCGAPRRRRSRPRGVAQQWRNASAPSSAPIGAPAAAARASTAPRADGEAWSPGWSKTPRYSARRRASLDSPSGSRIAVTPSGRSARERRCPRAGPPVHAPPSVRAERRGPSSLRRRASRWRRIRPIGRWRNPTGLTTRGSNGGTKGSAPGAGPRRGPPGRSRAARLLPRRAIPSTAAPWSRASAASRASAPASNPVGVGSSTSTSLPPSPAAPPSGFTTIASTSGPSVVNPSCPTNAAVTSSAAAPRRPLEAGTDAIAAKVTGSLHAAAPAPGLPGRRPAGPIAGREEPPDRRGKERHHHARP